MTDLKYLYIYYWPLGILETAYAFLESPIRTSRISFFQFRPDLSRITYRSEPFLVLRGNLTEQKISLKDSVSTRPLARTILKLQEGIVELTANCWRGLRVAPAT